MSALKKLFRFFNSLSQKISSYYTNLEIWVKIGVGPFLMAVFSWLGTQWGWLWAQGVGAVVFAALAATALLAILILVMAVLYDLFFGSIAPQGEPSSPKEEKKPESQAVSFEIVGNWHCSPFQKTRLESDEQGQQVWGEDLVLRLVAGENLQAVKAQIRAFDEAGRQVALCNKVGVFEGDIPAGFEQTLVLYRRRFVENEGCRKDLGAAIFHVSDFEHPVEAGGLLILEIRLFHSDGKQISRLAVDCTTQNGPRSFVSQIKGRIGINTQDNTHAFPWITAGL